MTKIILSRKGFDSGTGGKPSLILGDQLYSIPIPQADSGIFYKDLRFEPELPHSFQTNYLKVLKDLGISFYSEAHLDPDLNKNILSTRSAKWKALFGQTGAALSHLRSYQIGEGDLFLFFGWFREVEITNGECKYKKGTPDLHVIYGYMEVEKEVDLKNDKIPDWMKYHPHYVFKEELNPKGNSIFVARERSAIFPGKRGAGLFRFHKDLCLTNLKNPEKSSRSIWALPGAFFDSKRNCRLSYHHHKKGVAKNAEAGMLILNSANRGQEFITSSTSDLSNWLMTLQDHIIGY